MEPLTRAACSPSSHTLAPNSTATSAWAQCHSNAAPAMASSSGKAGGYFSKGICAKTGAGVACHGENACAITRYEALSSWNVASPGCQLKATAIAPAASATIARAKGAVRSNARGRGSRGSRSRWSAWGR